MPPEGWPYVPFCMNCNRLLPIQINTQRYCDDCNKALVKGIGLALIAMLLGAVMINGCV